MNGFPQLTGIVGKQFDAVFTSEVPRIKNEPDIEVAFCRKNGTVTIKDRTNKNADVVLTGVHASNFHVSFEQMKRNVQTFSLRKRWQVLRHLTF